MSMGDSFTLSWDHPRLVDVDMAYHITFSITQRLTKQVGTIFKINEKKNTSVLKTYYIKHNLVNDLTVNCQVGNIVY